MSLMLAQMGMSLVGGVGQYASANITADLKQAAQAYRNTMNELSAARSLNAVTINEVRTRDAATTAELMIQRTAIKDQAKAEVGAAAAGVTGNSVKLVMDDLKASAGRASYAQRRQATQQLGEMSEQKKSIALSAITNTDIQVIPKPSVGSMLLGVGTNLLGIYDSHQPASQRVLG